MADIHRIAELAKVSTATVSRVVNNHPHVSEATRQRVLTVIEEQNYYPNALAANLRRKRSDIIGYLQFGSPRLEDSRMAQSAESKLFEAGFKTVMCNADEDVEREQFFIEEMIGRRIAGAILCPQGREDRAIQAAERLKQAGITSLLLGSRKTSPGISSVSVNRPQGWQIGLDHLHELGHRVIAFIGTTEADEIQHKATSKQSKELNFIQIELIGTASLKVRVANALEHLSKHHPDTTALFCASEPIAAYAIQTLDARSIAVPDQMSVLCFGGTDFSRMIQPRISLVGLPVDDLGLLCAQQLMNLIDNPQAPARNILIENQLAIGDTTKSL